MAIYLALSSNGRFSCPAEYPIRLAKTSETMVIGTIPNGVTSVSATVSAFAGSVPSGVAGTAATTNALTTASVHLALFAMPATSGGADGEIEAQEDLTGLTGAEQTITVEVPTGAEVVPVPYVVKLWVDELHSTNGVELSSMSIA